MYKIHEDSAGGISVTGATIQPITGPQDALRYRDKIKNYCYE